MPPKPPAAAAAIAQAGPSNSVPPPGSPTPPPDDVDRDAQDMLVLQDLMDTLEQMPTEMTRVHSDLNELGAVLYSTLQNLEAKLGQLIESMQDNTVRPEKRFSLLMDIAEEAARYKLGGDDKIRVAAGACDGLMMHQKHINNLLASSSLLDPAPHSPYTRELTLAPFQPTVGLSRRQIARQQNSPFTGPGGSRAGGNDGRVGDTPTKKKKSRVQQLGREDDESSSVGGRKVVKKKKPVDSYGAILTRSNPRAPSPTDSVASASFAPNPAYPRTARQLAAAQAAQQKAKRAERDADDSDESEPERMPEVKKRSLNSTGPGGPSGNGGASSSGAQGMQVTQSSDSAMGLGLDMYGAGDSVNGFAGGIGGSGTGNGNGQGGSRSAGATPNMGATQMKKSRTNTGGSLGTASTGGVGMKRARDDDDSEDDGQPLARGMAPDGSRAGPSGSTGPGTASFGMGPNGQSKNMRKPSGMPPGSSQGQGDGLGEHDHTDGEAGGDGEGDGKLYCTCRQISYGEMIGCDDDECIYEWYHIGCLGFDRPPEGTWYCPSCVERRRKNPKTKRPAKTKARR